MSMTKKYGQTFWTKPIAYTTDIAKADKSIFVWRDNGENCTLSRLGILNGFLNKVGLVLYFEVDDGIVKKLRIAKVWW